MIFSYFKFESGNNDGCATQRKPEATPATETGCQEPEGTRNDPNGAATPAPNNGGSPSKSGNTTTERPRAATDAAVASEPRDDGDDRTTHAEEQADTQAIERIASRARNGARDAEADSESTDGCEKPDGRKTERHRKLCCSKGFTSETERR
jgi:hypothetical protein